jgi:hypothetical protein
MAGLVPAIHVLGFNRRRKTWMPGTSPGMTMIAVRASENSERAGILDARFRERDG